MQDIVPLALIGYYTFFFCGLWPFHSFIFFGSFTFVELFFFTNNNTCWVLLHRYIKEKEKRKVLTHYKVPIKEEALTSTIPFLTFFQQNYGVNK